MINGLDPAKHEPAVMLDACVVPGVTHGTYVRPEPKRYLDPHEREILFREGGMNAVYAAESGAAGCRRSEGRRDSGLRRTPDSAAPPSGTARV